MFRDDKDFSARGVLASPTEHTTVAAPEVPSISGAVAFSDSSKDRIPKSKRVGQPSKRTRFEVFKRDSFCCGYCGGKPPSVVLEVDHIVPRSKGGTNDKENLLTSCKVCNAGKSDIRIKADPKLIQISKEQREASVARLAALAEIAMQQKEHQEEQLTIILCHWSDLLGDVDALNPYFEDRSVLRFLQDLTIEQVIEAVNLTVQKCRDKSGYSQFKYFCGVCWTKIRYPDMFPNEMRSPETPSSLKN